MGQEIGRSHFGRVDFEKFSEHLRHETELLQQWVESGRLDDAQYCAGYEMEAWLLNQQFAPEPRNLDLLNRLDDPLVVPELARFNFELNGQARFLRDTVFSLMHSELRKTWQHCRLKAAELGMQVLAIGTLPTARPADFCLANMSAMERYKALNTQVLNMRRGKPIHLDINGNQQLQLDHPDVMLEAATTSFQIHLQVPLAKSVRFYNASKILSAPLVAAAANSPYLFGRDLWAETRIPVFEQAVAVGHSDLTKRVSFGIRYAHESLMEVFDSNLARYPILLPHVMNAQPDEMLHLRLHNGTIWRWNRPLLGFDAQGKPHFRLEQRCVPAGPSLVDGIANMAFYYGLAHSLAEAPIAPESRMPFRVARDNFYRCAQVGLDASVTWLDGENYPVRYLLLDQLLPQARAGLHALGIDELEADRWLSVIEQRVSSAQNGTAWQRGWCQRHGNDWPGLVKAYLQRQSDDQAVHLWDYD